MLSLVCRRFIAPSWVSDRKPHCRSTPRMSSRGIFSTVLRMYSATTSSMTRNTSEAPQKHLRRRAQGGRAVPPASAASAAAAARPPRAPPTAARLSKRPIRRRAVLGRANASEPRSARGPFPPGALRRLPAGNWGGGGAVGRCWGARPWGAE